MAVKVENVEKNQVKLEIEVSEDKFEDAMQKSYINNVKHFNIPGFRKGKAPRKFVEKTYGESILYDDAVNIIIPDAYDNAVEETGISPVDRPQFDIVTIGSGKPFVFTALVTVKPEVVLGDYKGVEIEKVEVLVNDDEVDKELAKMQQQNSRIITVEDRAAKLGDTAVINFEGFVDGVPFEGGKGDDYSLEIGSNTFIPGFEDQLIGHNIGESFDVNVSFPEDYHAEELKGKASVFKVTINSLQEKELPVIDDEFAKDVSEFDSLEDLKKDILEKLVKEAKRKEERQLEDSVIKKIVEAAEVDIPDCMIEQQIEKMVKDYSYRMQSQGITLEQYFQYTGSSMEDLRAQMKETAKNQVLSSLVIDKISQIENVEATEEDVEEQLNEMATQYNMELSKVKELMAANLDDLKKEIRLSNTVKMLVNSAVQK